jgi:hypothetical protein
MNDQFGIKAARRYEQRMVSVGLTTPILRRAEELREEWTAQFNLYHTENAPSILMAAQELGESLRVS